MKRSTLMFLLGISVLFNVFFIFGAMQWDTDEQSERNRVQLIERIVSTMNLNQQQRDAFVDLRTEFEEETSILTQRIHDIEAMISEELRNEDPDLDALGALVQQEMALRNERRQAGSVQFERFLEFLTPEQRKLLGDRIERYRPRGPVSRKRMLEQFDHNKNGQLDPDERDEANALMERRRQDRQRREDGLHKQFDLDKDGFLSPDEEQAMHDWLKSRERRNGRGGRNGSGPPPHGPGEGPPRGPRPGGPGSPEAP